MGLRNVGVAALGLMALSSAGVAQAAAAGGPTEGLKLERVVMMMRHSIRPPTKRVATPAGTTAQPWSAWNTPYGELTPRGAEGARLMGVYYRTFLSARGLLPRDGCAAGGEVVALASSKQRAIKTAEMFVEGLQPGCGVKVDYPDSEDNDAIFHPSEGIDGDIALQAALRQKPGLAAEPRLRAAEFAVLQRVLGCDPATKAGCDIAKRPSHLEAAKNDTPEMEGALSVASTASQTVLLEYVEGKPMSEVGWGRASKADIRRCCASTL